ncbi:thioredoxin-disulfide reductase [bacterium]|nr:thioredoxin-disulfide reductase [bacterium]
MYDCVIIGGGPAGLAAGLYVARARLNALLVDRSAPGGQLLLTETVENYPGFVEPINAYDLIQQMVDQCKRFDLQFAQKSITGIAVRPDGLHQLETTDGRLVSRTTVLCTGAVPRRLDVPGEKEFSGKGVSYCATCDGAFFRGKRVAVIGGGDTAVEEGVFLTRFCEKVTIIHRRTELRAQKVLQERAFANPKIEFILGAVPVEIIGDTSVKGLRIKDTKTGAVSTLDVPGVFIFVGYLPQTDIVAGLVKLDESKHILTDDYMQTSVPGLFCAGDVRRSPLKQIATAVGEGAIAGWAVEKYITEHAGK